MCLSFSPTADGYAGWIAYNPNGQHLRVDLLTLHDVTKLVVQGSGTSYNSWTKQFKVFVAVSQRRQICLYFSDQPIAKTNYHMQDSVRLSDNLFGQTQQLKKRH